MKHIRIAAALAAGLLLAACHKTPLRPRFDTLAVERQLAEEQVRCRVDYRFVTIANAARSQALQAIEQRNIGYFFQLEEFAGDAHEAIDASLDEIATQLLAPLAGNISGREQPVEYEISVAADAAVRDTLLTYTIVRESYTGGAHGMQTVEYHTYSTAGGYELTLADLLDERQIAGLTKAIRRKLCAQYGAANDKALAALGIFPDYIAPTENFRLDGEELLLRYNPYDIACYAFGPVEVRFTAEELEALR